MNSNIYRQADSRWGSLPYPSKPYTLARSGCGCVAVTHCAIEQQKYWNYTPKDVRPYMVQFATRGNGTLWAGIKKGLEHYGYSVFWATQSTPMSEVWKVLNGKSLKRGIILFGSTKGPDKTVWTSDGHFISFVDYKIENNQHWFYLKDSGGRKHDKWWCYEKSMRGDVRQVWICTSMKETPKVTKPTGKYSGTIPAPVLKKGSKGDGVKAWQIFLNWYHPAWSLKPDGIFGGGTEAATMSFQATEGITDDGIYGKNSKAKAEAYKGETPPPAPTPSKYTGSYPDLVAHSGQKIASTAKALAYPKGTAKSKYTYGKGKATAAFTAAINKVYPKRSSWSKQCQAGASCDVGAGTVLRYSGYDPTIPRGLQEQIPYLQKSGFWKKTSLTKTSQMAAGDVGVYIGKKKGAHIWIGVGNKLIAEANHTAKYFLHIDTDNYTNSGKKTWGIYRACVATAIRKGDSGTEVTKLQNFLNWAGFDCGKADGIAGAKTETATKAFQKKTGLKDDGIAGSKTIAKAKEYVR